MNNNLLIVGASAYGLLAADIAKEMQCFEQIDFIDDEKVQTPDGQRVIGKISDLEKLSVKYSNVFISIEDSKTRLALMKRIEEEMPYRMVVLASPRAYIAPSVQIGKGTIIEPMAVIQTGAVVQEGCVISAGAVINYGSMCARGVHVECNAVVASGTLVPACTKVQSCTVVHKENIDINNLFENK